MPSENKKSIRVLIVDDSFFMRKILTEILDDSSGAITVLDSAQNGWEAVEKTKKLKPDVITMDVEMPKMDGLAALEKIMEDIPTPVVMLSSHTGKGTETTIKALELGAVDCVAKPTGRVLENARSIQGELVEKIKMASLCRLRSRAPAEPLKPSIEAKKPKVVPDEEAPERPATFVVAVASSTGGPRALNEFFSKIARNPSAAFVVVQHISAGFTKALARRLGDVAFLKVVEAEEGNYLMGGHAYVAPGGIHLLVEGTEGRYRFVFNDHPPRLGVKPSADFMMASVAKAAGKQCAGVVLTGMGRDGTSGLKDIHSAGGRTFAQDAESCVVYGMPKAAVESGMVDRQLTLDKMAEEVNALLSSRSR
jgi:two-component system chemotaxis response regulator CheB